MGEIVVSAHRSHPCDRLRELRIAGGQQRQASGEADGQDAHFRHVELLREAACSRADEVGRLAFHAIVGDAGDQRRHHEESARRHGARGIHQPGIVDPQPVHAVNNDDAGREANSARHVHMHRNRVASEVEGGVAHVNRMHFVVGQPSGGIRIGNALQQRSRLQIVSRERIEENHGDRKQ